MKKLFALLMVAAMTLTMAVVASAAGQDNVTITVQGGNAVSVYSAWQILDATKDPVDEAKIYYSLNNKYTSVLQSVTSKTAEADIIAYIAALDANGMRAFADNLYAAIGTANLAADSVSAEGGAFNTVASGYYLIAETTIGTQPDEASLVMVDTAGLTDVTVNTKESVPTVTKKVKDTNDTTGAVSAWQDAADYDIGDEIPFQLTGTLPNDDKGSFAKYATYAYTFTDTLSNGLTYKSDSAVVKIDDVTVDPASYTLTWENQILTIAFADLKVAENAAEGTGDKITVTKDSKVTVDYVATLNQSAVIGSAGNPNTVQLSFSNNPYGEGTGTTAQDKVVVFTYALEVVKNDGANAALNGAGFTLYKWNGTAYVAVGDEIVGNTTNIFTWNGLDEGKYKIVETTVPEGYNKAADVEFTIDATYDVAADDPALTGLVTDNSVVTLKTDLTASVLTTTVINRFGTVLPSTGGIGTTIFYVCGSLLFVGAGILLVTKKRMSVED